MVATLWKKTKILISHKKYTLKQYYSRNQIMNVGLVA
jgi:hypothetical protein